MSLPLKDLRTAIDERTHIVLSAAAAARGITMSELAREVIEQWSARQLVFSISVHRDLAAAGLDK